jgi:uncharacterized protein (TIGR02118 family)
MQTMTLVYPRSADARFDYEYYLNTHMKMVTDSVGDACRSITVETGEGDTAPFATVRFVVDSMEAFGAALAPHNEKLRADMVNYTDVQPTMHVSKLAIDHAGKGGG